MSLFWGDDKGLGRMVCEFWSGQSQRKDEINNNEELTGETFPKPKGKVMRRDADGLTSCFCWFHLMGQSAVLVCFGREMDLNQGVQAARKGLHLNG